MMFKNWLYVLKVTNSSSKVNLKWIDDKKWYLMKLRRMTDWCTLVWLCLDAPISWGLREQTFFSTPADLTCLFSCLFMFSAKPIITAIIPGREMSPATSPFLSCKQIMLRGSQWYLYEKQSSLKSIQSHCAILGPRPANSCESKNCQKGMKLAVISILFDVVCIFSHFFAVFPFCICLLKCTLIHLFG